MREHEDLLVSHYAQLDDEELLRMHRSGALTDVAYDVLESELSSRKLHIPPRPQAPVIEEQPALLDRTPFWVRLIIFVLGVFLINLLYRAIFAPPSSTGDPGLPSAPAVVHPMGEWFKLVVFQALPMLLLARILFFRRADQEDPKGLSGWLILPLLGLILSPLWMGFYLVRDLLPAFSTEAWKVLTRPGTPAYDPLWAPLLIFEAVASVALLLFTLVLLFLFVKKSRRTPKLFIAWLLSLVGLRIADQLLGSRIPVIAQHPDPQGLKELAQAILAALIWIPYFMRSKRVKNTFVEPVSSGPLDGREDR